MTGASTRQHPAPYPLELANRLVRMFSFHGDTVLDPFCGTGTTMLAALNTGRNSIGVDIDPEYCRMALRRLDSESGPLFAQTAIEYHKAADLLAAATIPAVADSPASSNRGRPRTRRS
jgi:modification methylase